MLPATAVSLVDGMNIELLSGLGKLDPNEDKAEYDKKYVHTDVLVVGGGIAGVAAAREAVRTGARVILIDDQPELGGALLSGSTAPGIGRTDRRQAGPGMGCRRGSRAGFRRRMHGAEPHHRIRLL